MPAHLGAQNAEAVLGIVVGDALDKARPELPGLTIPAAASCRRHLNRQAADCQTYKCLPLRRRPREPSPGSELAPWERVLSE